MVKINSSYIASGESVARKGTGGAESFGKMIAEALAFKSNDTANSLLKESGISLNKKASSLKESLSASSFKENYLRGTFREDLTTSNGVGAYTKLLHKVILMKAYDKLDQILEGFIIFDDLKNSNGGVGSLQIPIGQPTVAYEIAEGQVINRFNEGITEITVVPRQVAAGTAITWRMTKRALPSVVQWIMNNAANAIQRKVGGDLIAGLVAGAGTTQAGWTSATSYADIITARATVNSAVDAKGITYGFEATHVYMSYQAEADLMTSADWKNHVQYAVAVPGADLAVNRNVQYFGTMKLVTVPYFVGTDRALVLDSNYAAAYVPESDVETFEGSIPGRPYDREIVLLMSIGNAVLYPKAIVRITV